MASADKLNCWDYMKCGCEKNGTCAAATQLAGRRCWLIAGSLSGGNSDCANNTKISNCKACDFYSYVKTGIAFKQLGGAVPLNGFATVMRK